MRKKTEVQKAAQRKRTAQNKCKRIYQALKTAGGQAVNELNKRLKFYQEQLK